MTQEMEPPSNEYGRQQTEGAAMYPAEMTAVVTEQCCLPAFQRTAQTGYAELDCLESDQQPETKLTQLWQQYLMVGIQEELRRLV